MPELEPGGLILAPMPTPQWVPRGARAQVDFRDQEIILILCVAFTWVLPPSLGSLTAPLSSSSTHSLWQPRMGIYIYTSFAKFLGYKLHLALT